MEQKQQPKGVRYGSSSLDGKEMKENFVPDEIIKQSGYVHKSDLEFARYKQDCKKKALEYGAENAYKEISNASALDVLSKAEVFYAWLVTIPES